jgi:hypothetical protein
MARLPCPAQVHGSDKSGRIDQSQGVLTHTGPGGPRRSVARANVKLNGETIMAEKVAQIRALNDKLRQNLTGGSAVITPGIAALGHEAVNLIIRTISVFDDFCHANDPHEEHDFGSRSQWHNDIL